MTRPEALIVLGIADPFTQEELLREYHRRLFKVHPDTAREALPDVARLVQRLLLAREVLLAEPSVSSRVASGAGGTDGYLWYREAAALVGDALDDYFRERLSFSRTPESSPGTTRLQENLLAARALFARVLETHPGGLWTPDAVEQIARINVWLGRKHRSFPGGAVEEPV